MAGVLYVRDVGDDVIEVLKRRAAAAGLSLSAYVARELTAVASRPTNAEVVARARRRVTRSRAGVSTADIVTEIHAMRAEREQQLLAPFLVDGTDSGK